LYDPSLVFVLELATVLALRDDETVRELAKDVTDALASVIRDTSKHHPVVVARSVYYLLSLLKASNVSLDPFHHEPILTTVGLRLHPGAGPSSHILELQRFTAQRMLSAHPQGPHRLLQRTQCSA
jgi:hypothetical protein